MSFQVGDRVRYKGGAPPYDRRGTIEAAGTGASAGMYDVRMDDGSLGGIAGMFLVHDVTPVTVGAAGQPATITTAQQYQQVTGMAPPPGMFAPYTGQAITLTPGQAMSVMMGDAAEPPVNVAPACGWCNEQHVSPKCERYAKLYAERLATGMDDCEGARAELVRWADARDEDERARKRRGLP